MFRCLILSLAFAVALAAAHSEAWQDAHARGVAEAEADLKAGTPTMLTFGLRGPGLEIDEATGVPYRAIAGCVVSDEILGRAEGYNSTVRAWHEQRGGVPGSLTPWLDFCKHPGDHVEGPGAPITGEGLTSPDGIWTLRKGERGVELVPQEADGEARICGWLQAPEHAGVHWGPVGSDLCVVTETIAGEVSFLHVIDLRRWLHLNRESLVTADE